MTAPWIAPPPRLDPRLSRKNHGRSVQPDAGHGVDSLVVGRRHCDRTRPRASRLCIARSLGQWQPERPRQHHGLVDQGSQGPQLPFLQPSLHFFLPRPPSGSLHQAQGELAPCSMAAPIALLISMAAEPQAGRWHPRRRKDQGHARRHHETPAEKQSEGQCQQQQQTAARR